MVVGRGPRASAGRDTDGQVRRAAGVPLEGMMVEQTRPIEVSGEGVVDFSHAAHGGLATAVEMPAEQTEESKRQQRVPTARAQLRPG